MPTRSLPSRPDLSQLKLQAHELHRALRDGHVSAAARVAATHPRLKGQPLSAILDKPPALADAQLVVAREYGFDSWPALKARVELGGHIDRVRVHPRFAEALAAVDAGDVARLTELLASDPSLVHARTDLDPPYGYFTGATLLHHVAGNPGRDRPLPANIVDVARALPDAGADANALTLGPSPSSSTVTVGSSTMGLVLTSKQASDMNVSGPLIDLLRERGVRLDLASDGVLDGSLANHAPRAAEKLIALGAAPDLLAAAALGRLDLVRLAFDDEGRLTARVRRQGREMDDRDAVGVAALYAYVRHQPDVVDYLLGKTGNWDMIGVNNGTLLHRAAWAGDLPIVQRLVSLGADINNRDNPYHGTPMDWAWHNSQRDVVQWIQEHCAVDLHNAVAYDLHDQVVARLTEDPASVNRRVEDGDIPLGTPLHSAARLNRVAIAVVLCDHGAHRDALAGDGTTPLDVADAHGSAGVAALLDERGARRAGDAPSRAAVRARPAWQYDEARDTIRLRVMAGEAEWEAALAALVETNASGLDARGQMTDAILARVAAIGHVTRLELEGSSGLTDAGIAQLSRLRLQHLDLSGTKITDRSLEILGGMPSLERLEFWNCAGITNAGVTRLAALPRLREVTIDDCRQVTADVASAFPAAVRVRIVP